MLHATNADNATHATNADDATHADDATNATHATSADDSTSVGGLKWVKFEVSLNPGQTSTIGTFGPLTFTAKCGQNAANPEGTATQDFLAILISTSQAGVLFDALDIKNNSPIGNTLDPATPEADRVWALESNRNRHRADLQRPGHRRRGSGSGRDPRLRLR